MGFHVVHFKTVWVATDVNQKDYGKILKFDEEYISCASIFRGTFWRTVVKSQKVVTEIWWKITQIVIRSSTAVLWRTVIKSQKAMVIFKFDDNTQVVFRIFTMVLWRTTAVNVARGRQQPIEDLIDLNHRNNEIKSTKNKQSQKHKSNEVRPTCLRPRGNQWIDLY